MEHNDKEAVKNLFKMLVIFILFTITCAQAFSVAKYIKSDMIENINLSVTPPPKKLLTGVEFNKKLKDSSSSEDSNNTITKIVFDYWDNGYMEDTNLIYSKNDWTKGTAVDTGLKGAIKMFKSDDGKSVYILSESTIYANVDSAEMFYNLNSIVEFKFNNLNVSNVENMNRMFGLCSNLEILDLSSFDTINAISARQMFTKDEKLTTIYVSEKWNTDRINHTDITEADEPFLGCTKLTGEKGTIYNEANIDIMFARVDQGEEKPGYLTYKEEGVTFFKDMNLSEKQELEQVKKDTENEINNENSVQTNETKTENTVNEVKNETVGENKTVENTTLNNEVEKNNVEENKNQDATENKVVEENTVDENTTSSEANIA